MDKGWGLTLDSDHLPTVSNFVTATNKTPTSTAAARFRTNGGAAAQDHSPSVRMFHHQFPASDSINNNTNDDNGPSPSDDDHDRVAVDEVDFFSSHNKSRVADHDRNKTVDDATTVHVKKEKEINSRVDQARLPPSNVNTGLHLLTANTGSDQSTVDDGVHSDHMEDNRAQNELGQLQVELRQMNTENQRLRDMLTQVTNNYKALQVHLVALMQQQQNHRPQTTQEHDQGVEGKVDRVMVPRQFIELGPSAAVETTDHQEVSNSSSEDRTLSGTPPNNIEVASPAAAAVENSSGKRIGRDESPESETQGWGPNNKVQKLNSVKGSVDQSNEATMRKARVSVRARSEAPMITDGCQWRKYGQKMAKGNPCPRAYYRCTMAVGCPVRKQVQRCAEDRTILITTYEGNHNHPLPPAAMAMASTTTSAANMLLSGSMSSADGIMNPNLLARAILPCSSSMATISASAPFPTVTLDLTHSPNPLQFQRQPTQFQLQFPGHSQNFGPGVSNSSHFPQVLGESLYNQSKFSGLQLSQGMGSSSSQLNSSHQSLPPQLQQPQHLSDTVSAATAAITADPNFTAALAAAITSIIGGAQNPFNINSNSPQQHKRQQ